MKLLRATRLLLASWLALSCFGAPIKVFADVELLNSPQITEQTSTINNDVVIETTSGDALAESNTDLGTLATGDANSVTTVITTDSATSLPETDSFNIYPTPNTVGDITLDIPTNQEEAVTPTIIPITSDLENITNSLAIASISGDATANSNTSIAQIDTGDAYSNANVINILGSNVSAPEIFLGYITVDGSLTGDILLPNNLLQAFNNQGAIPNQTVNLLNDNKAYNVSNTVDALATSGNLLAINNSVIGSSESGDSTNMLNSLDLLGVNIYGQIGLLVFVNVAGTWDGSILSQNPGVKAALISSDGINSTPLMVPLDTSSAISLTNNVKISAVSGDIAANKNSKIGDMATGDSTTVVNIANILGSNLIFTKQFGILFITVLGDWYGSFGLDTPYGNPPSTPPETPIEKSTEQSTSSIKSTFISISKTKSNGIENNLETEFKLSSIEHAEPKITINDKKRDSSIAEYMIWGIPLIGGSIALGLARTDKMIKK